MCDLDDCYLLELGITPRVWEPVVWDRIDLEDNDSSLMVEGSNWILDGVLIQALNSHNAHKVEPISVSGDILTCQTAK